jgi:AcrR family transcriptional regulator
MAQDWRASLTVSSPVGKILPMTPAAPYAAATPSGRNPVEAEPVTGAGSGREGLLAAARAELAEHGHAAISLRAVARRAGVSHAAPKYHFRDRAALLTAVAAEGFLALAAAIEQAVDAAASDAEDGSPDTGRQLAALGRAYIDFGLANPALFDLMFRPSELHPEDPALQLAQREATRVLASTAVRLVPSVSNASGTPPLALVSWALVHGLVVLTRDGALAGAAGSTDPQAAADLARSLTEVFTGLITRSS